MNVVMCIALILLNLTIPYSKAVRLAAEKDRQVVIQLSASWCEPCQRLRKRLDRLYPNYVYIDIDKEIGLAKTYMKGDVVPQLIVLKMKKGKLEEVARQTGELDDNEVKRMLGLQ